ncbi:DUF5709 domain-containing protein [Jatrophihabitans telluris]|uniref:DUF5709 domain-containing protein n=1 Tax=Jatrophihabitans telluris TaxID=2038343 RepID=A0ABY4R2U0_9ACTN|nr:DUF5709 domain-containing protein [Jatrophihabitans telluris]UQX90228.1 DUF5709 domain-containing protein [Jatrophihabitans telluris]
MSDNDDSVFGDSVYEGGVEDAEDFDPIENLTGDDPDENEETSYSPPDHRPSNTRYGTTELEQSEGESLDQRLAEEEPDIDPDAETDEEFSSPDPRAGRLVAPDEGAHSDEEKDEIAFDAGPAGYAASAEEAAVHVISDDEYDDTIESDSVDD